MTKKIGAVLAAVLVLAGCGLAKLNEAESLTAEQLAQMPDDYVCKEAQRMAVLNSYVTPMWLRELRKRNLSECTNMYIKPPIILNRN